MNTYRIVDHGVEHEQYFQGHGVSFTEYDECATGIGGSAREAAEDALETLCQGADIDPDTLAKIEAEIAALDDTHCEPDTDDFHYYVSIDIKRPGLIRLKA